MRLEEESQSEPATPTAAEAPSPSTSAPPGASKFEWLKSARERRERQGAFPAGRPHLGHAGDSTADLFQFENSRVNLFDGQPAAAKVDASKYDIQGISLWGSRTILEKCLIILSGVLVLIAIILASILASGGREQGGTAPEERIPEAIWSAYDNYSHMCMSGPCVYTASEIIRSLDLSRDPCDDFYEYSCGGWVKNNPIPDGKSMWGIFGKIELQNQLIIRNALDKIDTTKRTKLMSKAELKAKIYFESCMDANETIEALAGNPLLEVVRKNGGWNLVPETMTKNGQGQQKWSLQKVLQNLQNRYNLGGLFNWAVGEDDRNSSRHVIIVDQGGFNLPTRDNYLNRTAHKKILDAYLEYMTKLSVLLGANETAAREQMQKVIDFETDLANITTPSEERRDENALYNPMNLSELQVIAPFLRWRDFFNDAFRFVSHKVSEKEIVVIYAPEYLKKLNKLIEQYLSTDEGKTTLANYLVWQLVRPLSSFLSKPFRDAAKILRKALFGSEGGEEAWRYCVSDTNNAIGFAVGAMFVREVFHGEAKPLAEEMINRIRKAFKDNLKNLSWMDDETRSAAEIKADAIGDMIGFPDYILDTAELDKQYADLNVKPDEYFQNNIEVNMYTLKKNLEKLDEPVNRTRWGMTPSTVNAYYTPTKNQIVFPAGILQPPFYDGLSPKSVNYGAMGVVMGHELTHAFDDQGREYDRFGNLNQWWNNKTIDLFKNRAKCIQDQYSKYVFDGHGLNGKQTLGENIADNGGLKAAFHAYVEASKSSVKNETLPGLGFNHRQLFFISFAQVWCSSMTKEAGKLQIEKDDHTVAKYRVIGPLSNLPEFSAEFKCPLGSKMNPKNKCEIW